MKGLTENAAVAALQRAQVLFQGGRPGEAADLLVGFADDAACQFMRGHCLFHGRRLPEAAEAYARACVLDPRNADAHYNLGGVRQTLKDWEGARAEFAKAARLRPGFADAWARLAVTLTELNRLDEAAAAFDRAVACEPASRYALERAAAFARRQGRLHVARDRYLRGARLAPRDARFPLALAEIAQVEEMHEEALAYARVAVDLDPASAEARFRLGTALQQTGALAEAEAALRASLERNPASVPCLFNLATVIKDLDRLEEAAALYRQVIAARPDHADAWANLGWVLDRRGQAEPAREACEQALGIDPEHANAHYNLGWLLARRGELGSAWPHMEWRFSPRRGPARVAQAPPAVACSPWDGGDLSGRRLLIWPEQGLGDMLQFCRYAELVKEAGAREVIVGAYAPMVDLLAGMAGVDRVYPLETGAPPPECDAWCWLMSLPRLLGTDRIEQIPARLPYLRAPQRALARQRDWIEALPGPRIGLAWKGNPRHVHDDLRSLPVTEMLAPLAAALPGASFVNLQYGDTSDQLTDTVPLHRPHPPIRDFADAAALIEMLDLVICVDTATAHLAGALGRPVWVMLPVPRALDWRWLEGRTDSPWYPGVMRLFRQETDEDWGVVIARVAAGLERYLVG
jgi:tetratricopeptide (TPR) repeat protein